MKRIALLLIAGTLLTTTACKKTGPQGPQGVPGQQGPAGQNGLDGNANVIGTDAFTVTNWELSGRTYSATFTDADITPSIVDHGIVEIFKSYGINEWTNLPDVSGVTNTVFNFYDNGFTIYVQNSDGTTPIYPGSQIFRVVIISASQKQAHPNTNWKDYKQAVTALATSTTSAGTAQ
ncbi:MAG: hypothetical protein JWQ38_1127 [Flavipsychrobacter sp.]|nr:hypothetical protein [Flavipsychrobacter sp.]